MIRLKDYNAAEIQKMLSENREFILEDGESNLYIEFPESSSGKELTPEDGVLMSPGHKCRADKYLHPECVENGKVYARLTTAGNLRGTGIVGMTGQNIKALLTKLGGTIKDRKDVPKKPVITEDFFLSAMTYRELQEWVKARPELDELIALNQSKDVIIAEILELI